MLAALRAAVLDRILDQRLEQQRRHQGILEVGVDRELDAKLVAKAGTHDGQIAVEHVQLLAKRHDVTLGDGQRQAQEGTQTVEHLVGRARVFVHRG